MRRGLPLTLFALVALALPALAKGKPTVCGDGRFLVQGKRLIGSDADAGADALIVTAPLIAIDSGCPPVKGTIRAGRTATKVKATWRSCTGVKGPVRLVATIDAKTCRAVRGSVQGKKAKLHRRFKAGREVPPAFTTGDFTDAPLATAVVGPDGGTVAITDPASGLNGLSITLTPGATSEPITFAVSSAQVTGATDLPSGATPSSRMIRLEATGSDDFNDYRTLDQPALVTLPYDPPAQGEDMLRFYIVGSDGSLHTAGFAGQDLANHTVSFYLRSFADAAPPAQIGGVAPQAPLPPSITLLGVALTLTTPATVPDPARFPIFKTSDNGWFIPNAGSYYEANAGGSCLGMVASASHYFRNHYTPKLIDAYRDNWPDVTKSATTDWEDDAVAIEYTSRAQKAANGFFSFYGNKLQNPAGARATMLTMVGALYVTHEPIPLGIQEGWIDYTLTAFPLLKNKNHAVLVYQASVPAGYQGDVAFKTYDPNFPRDNNPVIHWNPTDGFQPYQGSPISGYSDVAYNTFNIYSYTGGAPDALLDRLKVAADRGFVASEFPHITINSITGKNNNEVVYDRVAGTAIEGKTGIGEHKFITSDSAVVIQGTITGGLAQSFCCTVSNAVIFLSGKVQDSVYNAPVNNSSVSGGDGSFQVTMPVPFGEHELVIMGGKYTPGTSTLLAAFREWAAFYRNHLESTATPATLTVTLNWDQAKSDIDLYVKEPDATDGSGKIGDTVFYSHRLGSSDTHPFLEFDNTAGSGTEYYRAKMGAKTLYTDASEAQNLYGMYTAKVHYYADHDDKPDKDQTITWKVSWRYLAECPDPCTNPERDGVWKEDSKSNVPSLTTANSGNCCNIGNTGPDWSNAITIDYPSPNTSNLSRPNTVNLP